ncbi:unnamed protein product [Dracunculus medinensis]|uniref:RRM domain-containing protein n=1 Tax=Dracunculus medinensis TaxID=318479 RepID=A0A0N4UM79_DRAME|nr:unnamed protein product [Dracunculus medinensis]
MNSALLVYDACGNPYQMTTAYHPSNLLPAVVPFDNPIYEMIPHRIFVGGFPATTTELDLRTFFEQFGHVREAKVIRSNEGTSKGYGFITFDSEEENQDLEKLEFKGRRLNLGPAMRRIVRAASTEHIFAAATLGGLTYAYPRSPFVILPPGHIQPLIYSPVQTAPSPLISAVVCFDNYSKICSYFIKQQSF